MINKIISGIIAIGLLISSLALPAAAPASGAETGRGGAIFEKLVALGIFDGSEGYADNSEITRGAFTRSVMKLCGDAADVYKADNAFGDVNPTSDDGKYILAAYAMGFVNGNGDGNFYPESTISFAEAIKLTVCAIGYKPVAEAGGGYPGGYINAAIKAKLFSGMGSESGTALTWNDAMILIENALDANICVADVSESNKYYIKDDSTILSERYSIYKTDGIVEANEYTDLMSADSDVEPGRVIIGDVEYDIGATGAADFLGMNTEIYYMDDGKVKRPKLMYITLKDDDNRITVLGEDDISSADKTEITYVSADKVRTAKIDGNATMIYNGKMAELTAKRLIPEYGTVTLIDNDGDSVYDVVKVMNYEPYAVQNVSAVTKSVRTKQGVIIELDENSEDYYAVIKNNEETKTFEDIKSGQIILYAESETSEKPIKTALLSDKKVSGRVTAVSASDNKISIDDEEYEIKPSLKSMIKLKTEGVFYIDARGRIVYTDYTSDIVYGYLTGIKTEGLGDVVCRIFTENSHWVTLVMNDKIKLNGKTVTASAAKDSLGATPDDYCQLIRYLVNNDGKITAIEIAENIPSGSDGEADAIQKDIFRLSVESSQIFRTSAYSFNGLITVGTGTKIFAVSSDAASLDEDNVMMKSISDIEDGETYSFKAYNVNGVRTAPVLVIYDYNATALSDMMLVRNSSGEMLSNDDTCPALEGYLRGLKLTMPVSLRDSSPVKDIKTLKSGDVITFGCNNKGEIDYIDKRASVDSDYALKNGVYNLKTYITGYVTNCDTDEKKAVIRYDAVNSAAFSISSLKKVYIYDAVHKDFSVGSIDDIREDDHVVARARNLVCQEMFILRNGG